jgi:DNA helicase II / ATP-dependent DNA helicase PcrA
MEYSKNQLNAISLSNKNLRIIACAGSGKTSTIAAKVSYLLNSEGENLAPENIIAFTYTNRAAAELKNKILNETGELRGMADMFIGTIHAWCLAALKDHVFEYQNFEVLDEIKLKLFVDKYYDTVGMPYVTKLSAPNIPMKKFVDTSLYTKLIDIIRESELTQELPNNIEFAKSQYEETLKNKHYFDFSMCMDKALECLDTNENLRNQIKNKLKYLIVDEYQDVNPIQDKIIKKLQEVSNCKIIVVGDDDQNIYQWRGSNNEFIIDFNKRYSKDDFESIPLDINYRSSEGITKLAEDFISNNINRIHDKNMFSNNTQKFERGVDILYNEYSTIEEENREIAKYIETIKGIAFNEPGEHERGISYSDICILLRTWNRAESIAHEFDQIGIPYVTAGVNQLFDMPEVHAAFGIFEFIQGNIDSDDLKSRWMDIPNNNLDGIKIDNAISVILNEKTPAVYSKKGKWDYSLQDVFWEFLESGEVYEDSFHDGTNPNQKERAEIIFFNLGKFSQVINDFEEINFNTVSPEYHLLNFINFITYAATDYYPEGWLSNQYKTPNAVQIMTVHQAKGLEFPVVIIPGLNKNYLPSKKHGGLNVWHFLDRSLILNQNRYEPADNTEDERRLMYVALTRSQKYLLLTRAPNANNRLYRNPSSFIRELNNSNIMRSNTDFSFFNSKLKLEPTPKEKTKNIALDFTTLKDYFECSYRFKLVSMFGFRFPLNPRMGLGQSFHNVLMELHKKGKEGQPIDLAQIIERQTYFPHIGRYTTLEKDLKKAISKNIFEYYEKNKDSFDNIVFIEQDIQYKVDKEILVLGRVDLIKKEKDYGKYETTIIEFKSKEDVQNVKLTNDQLLLYALGHKELTGEKADYIMTYVIGGDTPQGKTPKAISDSDLHGIETKIKNAADRIRKQEYNKCTDSSICKDCFQNSICTERKRYNLKNHRN